MSKIQQAIEFCNTNKLDKDYHQLYEKGINILTKIINNSLFDTRTRLKSLLTLMKINPTVAIDNLARSRDKLSHLEDDENKKEELEKEIELLKLVVKQNSIPSHERLISIVTLYNLGYFEYYYDLFLYLCNDISVLIDHRIDAARYLLFSEDKKYVKNAKECIMKIIKTIEYPSEYRYKTIASFNSKVGISTLMNKAKLNIEYDEEFLTELQTEFFWNIQNDVRNRILSGQHLLDLLKTDDEKNNICEELLEIASNYENNDSIEDTENTRADAADVVINRGLGEYKERARDIITKLGFIKGKKVKKLTDKSKNVFNDKQNVHDSLINRSVQEFIKTLASTNEKIESYDVVHNEITDLLYKSELEQRNRIKAFKALNRISIDDATFTDYRLTSSEIFVHVWKKINDSEHKQELKKRLVEELIDMCDTCASGHASRLINILNGYGFELKIEWKDQLKSNMAARMQKRIQNIRDSKLMEQVILGMDDSAEPEERDEFLKFVTNEIPLLKKELYDEFVGGKYISNNDFEKYFEEGTSEWI